MERVARRRGVQGMGDEARWAALPAAETQVVQVQKRPGGEYFCQLWLRGEEKEADVCTYVCMERG